MENLPHRNACAAIAMLIVLQVVMLLALLTKTPPHPPEAVAPFAIGPFLGASMALAVAALILGPTQSWTGRGFSIAAALCALVSYGPQKYLDTQFSLIWPAVVLGQIAVLVLGIAIWNSRTQGDPASSPAAA